MKTTDAVTQLSALAQESRLAIFRLLVKRGPEGMVVGQIAEALGLANATLSFHLKTLTQASLINAQQEGRFINYSVNFAQMNSLLAFLTENCCDGKACDIKPSTCTSKS